MCNTEPEFGDRLEVATINAGRDRLRVEVPGSRPARASGLPAVRLIGPVQAVVDGVLISPSSPKLRRLLMALALRHNRVVSAERLIDEVWGEDVPESASAALHVYISRLRRLLAGSSSGPSPLQIGRRAPGYVLSAPEDEVDVTRFTRLAEAARHQVASDPAHALLLLDEALAMVFGEPLADVVDEMDPLAAEARQLREMVTEARERQVEALLGGGRPEAAAAHAGALLAAQPLRETAVALQVLALYRSGRSADALAAYEEFRHRLDNELGADPGPRLRRLHARILQQDPKLDGPPQPLAQPRIRADAGSSRSALVGRAPIMAQLEQALTDLAAGQGGVWTMSGEAGIGKTRLVEELGRSALGRSAAVVWGRGEEGAGEAPYRPWQQIIRALPDVAAAPPGVVVLGSGSPEPISRLHLHDTLAAALTERRDEPLVAIFEDIQWFDPLSLELLLSVARATAGRPLLLVLTLRQDSQTPAGLRSLMAKLARLPASQQIRVRGLSNEEAAELVVVRAGLPAGDRPDWIREATARGDGNPFFLTELTRLLQDQRASGAEPDSVLPLGIRDVLQDRLAGVSPDGRELLDAAAVIGRQAPYGLLDQVLGWPAARLDAALAEVAHAGLVTEQLLPELSVRFSHALVQELLLAELRPSLAVRRHAQVGMALAASPGRVDSERVLAHLTAGAAAVPVSTLVSALLEAARRASGQTAYEHAQRLLHRALELAEQLLPGPERDTVELRVQARLGSAIAAQLGWAAPAAEAALARAQALALRAEPDAETFGAIYHQVAWLVAAAQFDRATALSDELMARADRGPTELVPVYELLGRVTRGLVAWYRGLEEQALAELSRAHELSLAAVDAELMEVFTSDPAIAIQALLAHALVAVGRVEEGLAASREALVLARRNRPAELANALTAAALLAADRHEVERTRELAAELSTLARTHGLEMYQVMASLPLAWAETLLATELRAREQAVSDVRRAHDLFHRSGARQFGPVMAVLHAEAERAAGYEREARQAATAGLHAAERDGVRLWGERLAALAAG